MRKTFSGVAAFSDDQTVYLRGMTGKTVGWARGRIGKLVAVEITANKGGVKGKVFMVPPALVSARKGRKGIGPLKKYQIREE